MNLEHTPIKDLYVLNRGIKSDERGFFRRLFAEDEMKDLGRPTTAIHVNSSTSLTTGTLRGIHFQYPPYAETKVVSCVAGAIWDVAVDLRPESPTQFSWFSKELTPENGLSLVIPEGFGHAFLTLKKNTTAVYIVSATYSIEHESGALFNDPLLSINWPFEPRVISEKDKAWGLLDDRRLEINRKFAQVDKI